MRILLALRNVIRHKVRSFISILMIAGSVTAINLFNGFTHNSIQALKTIASESQFGHMQVAKKVYWSPGKEDRLSRMFDMKDMDYLKKEIPNLESISGRLSFYGLVSNGDLSVGAKIVGVDVDGEPGFKKTIKILSGSFLSKEPGVNEIIVGSILAKQLGVKGGDELTILTTTVDGAMNAMDLKVTGVFSGGIDEIDAQLIFATTQLVQKILDTDKVDIAVLKFNNVINADNQKQMTKTNVETKYPSLELRNWRDLAVLFRQVEKYYAVNNRLVEMILIVLMFLGAQMFVQYTL